ncbi:MAG: endonuclease [Bacteroidales bacterium]
MDIQIVKHIIRYIVVAANTLAAFFLLVSAYSDRIPPDKSLFFSYLGLIFPLICLLNLFFILYWALMRRWKNLLIGIGAFALCWNPCRNYFPVHFRSPVPKDNVIKILSYNVMGFAYTDHTKAAPNKIVEYIAHSGADIVCLQEYFIAPQEGKHLTEKKLSEALSMYPYVSFVRLKAFNWGLAVYSKYPISYSRRIDYRSEDNGSALHRIDINGKTLTLINNHLESFKLTSEDKIRYSDFIKGAGAGTFDSLKGTIRQKLGPAFLIRAQQARIVAEEIKKCTSEYIVVCGDFNDTPVSYSHRTVQGNLTDAFAESGFGLGVTYNKNSFWFRIDNIFHSPNMKAFNCTVDKIAASDHYPVWCYLAYDLPE